MRKSLKKRKEEKRGKNRTKEKQDKKEEEEDEKHRTIGGRFAESKKYQNVIIHRLVYSIGPIRRLIVLNTGKIFYNNP